MPIVSEFLKIMTALNVYLRPALIETPVFIFVMILYTPGTK